MNVLVKGMLAVWMVFGPMLLNAETATQPTDESASIQVNEYMSVLVAGFIVLALNAYPLLQNVV